MRNAKYKGVLILGSIFLLILWGCKINQRLSGNEVKEFELGYYSTFSIMGEFGYEFLDEKEVIYKWSSDLTRFERKGGYSRIGDTIEIKYEPVLVINKSNSEENETVLEIRGTNHSALENFPIQVFKDGLSEIVRTDSSGRAVLDDEIEMIDSLYFDWQFSELGIYPIDNKFSPRKDKVNEELINGYVRLEIIIDEDLLEHPINSNADRLLIIGRNMMFRCVDYDPEVVYIGGVLKKE